MPSSPFRRVLRGSARWIRPLISMVLIVILWAAAIWIFQIPAYQIPKPEAVAMALITDGPSLLRAAVPTTEAALLGFVLSVIFGIPAAMIISTSRIAEAYVYPLLVFSQSVPKVAVAPLFVVWFGFGLMPRIITAFLLGFFPVVVASVQGFKSVETDMVDLVRAMEANRWQLFRLLSLPHALPAIFSGLKVSVTLAIVGAVVGEFVGANSGLGFDLQRSIGTFQMPQMFAALVLLSMIGVALFWIIELIERLMIPWHVSRRQDIDVTA